MTQRLRRILIMIVMALLTVTLMAASLLCSVTYARYAGGKFNEEKSIYDQIIEFVGANQYEVYSPEELVEAIENGYSYIKIGKGAEEPFVITTGVTDVTANLVIDLNGTTIVRNSRNPVLDVQRNVSAVLVYDSTVENDPNAQPGSFYNPVGSALQVSGGTLTVAAGRYDSGPKDGIAVDFTEGNATSFKLFKRNGSRADDKGYTAVTGDSAQGQVTMPALTADVYIPQNVSSGYNFIEDDTYLIYSEEQNCYESGDSLIVNAVKDENGSFVGDALAVPCNAASCDFYYYYPIDEDGNPIKTDGTASAPQTYAVIYGYNDVKALAANDALDGTDLSKNGLVWPYAAVRSIRSTETVQEGEGRTTGGEGFMRGGAFSTYFGTENTYGIYAEGGTLSVADGVSFTAVGEGVCIRSQTSSTTTDSNAAASLEISGGTFSSELGDTIQMEGGSVTITGGTFTKNADVVGAQTPETVPEGTTPNNGSAIDIQGGTLKVNEKDTIAAATKSVIFNVTGDYVNGIKMTKKEAATQSDVIKNATFNFNETRGGTSVAAIQVAGGSLEVSGSNFNFNRKASSNTAFSHNNGIYVRSSGEEDAAQSGTVTAANCTFNFGNDSNSSVTASAGIASVGGEVTAKNCTFKLPGYSNYGIYATGGETTVTGGSITMTGRDTTQIGSGENAARGNDNFGINISGGEVTVSGCEISVSGTYSSGVLATNGTVNLSGTNLDSTTITITNSQTTETENYQTISTLTSSAVSSEGGTINLTGTVEIKSDSLGITARGTINVGDETTQAAANVTVNTENATGVYVNNGTLNVNAGATLGVTSTVRSNTKWVQPPEGQTEIPPSIYNGVYVNGGSLNSTGTLNVTFTGVENESHKSYDALKIRSYAVRVEAAATGDDTEVKITAGTIINQVQYDEQGKEIAGGGGGVYVGGGKVTLGISGEGGPTIGTTGVSFGDENTSAGGGNWKYYENKTGGHAVEVDAGELLVYNGLYTAKLGNGILVRGGNAWVLNGTFQGNDTETYRAKYGVGNLPAGPAAYYALKLLGGSVTTFGGTFGTDDTHTAEGSSAFVTGVDDQQAKANIYGGTFKVDGQAGFSVYQNVALTFTPKETVTVGEGQNLTGSDVTVSAATTAIAIENTTNKNVSVTINGGTFQSMLDDSGQRDGIWDSNPYAKLTINEGEKQKTTISALAKHGINLVYAPAIENRVTITGGTITGKQDGIYYGSNGTAANGLLISGGTITGLNGSGLNLAGAPAASGAVTITGGTFDAGWNGYPISGDFDQVVPQGYGITSGSNNWGQSCTIGAGGWR